MTFDYKNVSFTVIVPLQYIRKLKMVVSISLHSDASVVGESERIPFGISCLVSGESEMTLPEIVVFKRLYPP